ncbi:hypothetical protein TRFO_38333 [Tritrichomonas foetus]|uniref:Uncharacterized protein n=1 Tax=Tritrichomonas foetus TaxID=1144522 RepID=A0A1J4JE41_9EUKA|nr:hypothetical protein TRFO_38333 [Tritrichomonas foetus]|eukprot:OHS95524.1 hypothetical protein TRFO_38333 [Tritrichomonas foetus]
MTPRVGIPPRLSPLNHLSEQIRIDVYAELGMDPNGELFEVIQEKKKLKVKGLSLKNMRKKKKKIPKKEPEVNPMDEIEAENELRRKLGLPLLH